MTDETGRKYKVVRNHEEQYSLWPEDRDNPAGWSDQGTRGTQEECLAHIRTVWTDLRPRSVREAMTADGPPVPAGAPGGTAEGSSG